MLLTKDEFNNTLKISLKSKRKYVSMILGLMEN
jgi:hypothetical protein